MTTLFNFLKKYALVILIAFCIGAFVGYKTLERLGIAALINLISLFSLVDLIKEERNTLTDKEIYLLQKLANKK